MHMHIVYRVFVEQPFDYAFSVKESFYLSEEKELSRVRREDSYIVRAVTLQHQMATKGHDKLTFESILTTVIVIRYAL